MEKKSITIYDIADEAEVSTATVSRVIAGNYPVSQKTREKVNRIIKKYDFHPNAIARSLSNKRSKVLGFIVPAITNAFFSQVFIEAEKYALNKGYSVLLGNSLHNRELESKYMRMLLDQQAEGIILLGGLINDVNPNKKWVEELKEIQNRTKLVMINGQVDGINGFSVQTDEGKGVELLVQHLVEQGHTKIGFIGGVEGITTTDFKVDAFKKALKKYQLPFRKSWQVYSEYDIPDGERGLKELFTKNSDLPTAIIGINDLVAIGMIKENKKHWNKKIAITGFDNTDIAKTSTPELTTISHPYKELGRIAIDMMDDPYRATNSRKIILEPSLIVRESTIID